MHWEHLVEMAATWALDCVAPRSCAACEIPLAASGVLCGRCEDACAPPLHRSLGSGLLVLAASSYAGPMPAAIKRLKYGNRADIGTALGSWAAARLGSAISPASCIAPVPLHPRRLVSRGYNQTALLARGFAPTGAPLRTRLLARRWDTPPQAELSAAARRQNVQRAFHARPDAAGQRVWLLDDVVTTGATAAACAEALKAAGADVLGVLCIAVVNRDERGDGSGQLI